MDSQLAPQDGHSTRMGHCLALISAVGLNVVEGDQAIVSHQAPVGEEVGQDAFVAVVAIDERTSSLFRARILVTRWTVFGS